MNAPEKLKRYDRAAEDVGNLVHLEHVNVTQPDQGLATLFYVVGLGGTRDPYLMVGTDNMWVNFGRTQMHLPTRAPQRLRGSIGLVVPDLALLKARLERVSPLLDKTKFSWKEKTDSIEATCPWGNRFRLHAPAAQYGPIDTGMAYVDFDVPQGTAAGIARFYKEVMGAPAAAAEGRARVSVGRNQQLVFTETAAKIPEYDGHHFQIYIADFSGPYQWLKARELVSLETDSHEWRLQWIVDPADGRRLFQIEHEVRSLKHPLYARPLVNRNPGISNTSYSAGCDAFRGTY
jgi:hypothetical protein